ncbi:hypothetical protein B0A48_11541 [Cryoendolithus antarcticus]|uniref:Sin3 binding protein n=1 Tax=Cryoendolithus antarcticus TaxID=1507870 RepID=A0A1V8SVS7_9PEZI|nr:hypothetical protein B0A48_11541 [Cryoendolithus antarcticus]
MAQAINIAMAFASPAPSDAIAIPNARDNAATAGKPSFSALEKHAHALLTPPNSISPNMPAHGAQHGLMSPPLINIEEEIDLQDGTLALPSTPPLDVMPPSMPLSKGALSGLDASAAITPAMLAKDYLPGIMLGNGPKPIRHVIGELTHSVPGFSRIPPAKARRLVVAALEGRSGGGPAGEVAFYKTGWGRWDAHIKGMARDSASGSYNDSRFSPPRSENGSYALSHGDSGVGMSGPNPAYLYKGRSGESWTNSGSLQEDDELEDMEMDGPENEADKMSLDEDLPSSSDPEFDSATDDEDWAAVGPAALRKASLPTPGLPRRDYQALSVPITTRFPSRQWSRRPSGRSDRSFSALSLSKGSMSAPMDPRLQTPEEKAAVEALMSLGSM